MGIGQCVAEVGLSYPSRLLSEALTFGSLAEGVVLLATQLTLSHDGSQAHATSAARDVACGQSPWAATEC